MAYEAPTITNIGSTGITVTITGTDLGATSEVTITGLPRQVTLRRLKARKVSGSGSTIRPVLGRATDPAASGLDLEHQAASAAASQDEALDKPLALVNGTLYYRGAWDSGADNAEAVELLFERGWSS